MESRSRPRKQLGKDPHNAPEPEVGPKRKPTKVQRWDPVEAIIEVGPSRIAFDNEKMNTIAVVFGVNRLV